jgi:hypothetical protein
MSLVQEQERFGSFLKWMWFELRAARQRVIRSGRNWRERFSSPHAERSDANRSAAWPIVVGKSITPLWTAQSAAETKRVAGKVQNLRIAAARLHGKVLAAHEVFSFWATVGAPRRWRGFVKGRELREGCLIASIGGGLCQLSNALHLAALEAGLEIVERHAHSKIIPGSVAATGRDATVFWNYKDLRFRASVPFVIDATLTATHLIVQFRTADSFSTPSPTENIQPDKARTLDTAEDCVECRHRACVYHPGVAAAPERTALLLDERWPEFDRWLRTQPLAATDIAFVPIDGSRRGRPGYAWLDGMKSRPAIREHPLLVLRRSWKSRHLKAQGAARQKALLAFDAKLAQAYARKIPYDCQRLIVSLNLLPHLASTGVLGGRHVTVLLNRSPLFLLHRQLDEAAAAYPTSPTIRDFRAPAALVEQERAALLRADLLLTPHAFVGEALRAQGFPPVVLLPWEMPKKALSHRPGKTVLFPASALARKGAYEVRAVCREMALPLAVLGKAMECDNFWGRDKIRYTDQGPALLDIGCVILPAYVEHQPRPLLLALASGVPVICSRACGIPEGTPGVALIDAGNEEQLRAHLAHYAPARLS